MNEEEQLKRDYYARTASQYSSMHEAAPSPHDIALQALAGLLPTMEIESLLDVGAGTGRTLKYLGRNLPSLRLQGIEPVPELVREAVALGVPGGMIIEGPGEKLPFADNAFDAVTSFGVLHHVKKPSLVINEMLRVARKAVFISDSNRFAQGRPLARYAKLLLHATKLWPAFDLIRTRGRGYMVSEGDGLYYSYSVFDSLALLRSKSKRILTLELECPADTNAGIWSGTLCNASTLLVGAIK